MKSLKEILKKEYRNPVLDGILCGTYDVLYELEMSDNSRHKVIDDIYETTTYAEEGLFGGISHRECSNSDTYSMFKTVSGLVTGLVTFTGLIPASFVMEATDDVMKQMKKITCYVRNKIRARRKTK